MTSQKIPFKRLLAAILLLIPFFISGCIKEEMGSTSLNATLTLSVKDVEGQDLLNPATEGSLSLDYINLFHVIDGKEVFQYNAFGLTTPNKGMSIHHNETNGEYYLSVLLNVFGQKHGEISTSILKMHGYPADTLKAEVRNLQGKGGTSWSYSKVWINGEEFDLSAGETPVLIKSVH